MDSNLETEIDEKLIVRCIIIFVFFSFFIMQVLLSQGGATDWIPIWECQQQTIR